MKIEANTLLLPSLLNVANLPFFQYFRYRVIPVPRYFIKCRRRLLLAKKRHMEKLD